MFRTASAAALLLALCAISPARAGLLPFDPFNPATFGSGNGGGVDFEFVNSSLTSALASAFGLSSAALLNSDPSSPNFNDTNFGAPNSPFSGGNFGLGDGLGGFPLNFPFTPTGNLSGFNVSDFFGNGDDTGGQPPPGDGVPEPGSLPLLAGGLLALGFALRRRA